MTKKVVTLTILISFFTSILIGVLFSLLTEERILSKYGAVPEKIIQQQIIKPGETKFIPQTSQEEKVIEVVKKASPAVVSIIVTKDLPILEQYNPFEEFFQDPFFSPFFQSPLPQYRQKGTEKKEIGGGTGFIISNDGLILTNRHVVSDEKAEYTVLTNDGSKFSAEVLARDPIQDLAIIKIKKNNLPTIHLGNSDNIQTGQTVIAIGNALGEFKNTVSVGVISGLRRTITASGGGVNEILEEVIQTDAAINKGNSGGPLLNLAGEIIGVNTAIALGAENIGFAIPINKAKKAINDVKTKGKIIYPFLGVRYVIINKTLAEKNNLPVDYGALILRGEDPTELAITPGSAADKAGLQENDIILEFDGVKIDAANSLGKLISQKQVGDLVTLKILRKGAELSLPVTLDEKK